MKCTQSLSCALLVITTQALGMGAETAPDSPRTRIRKQLKLASFYRFVQTLSEKIEQERNAILERRIREILQASSETAPDSPRTHTRKQLQQIITIYNGLDESISIQEFVDASEKIRPLLPAILTASSNKKEFGDLLESLENAVKKYNAIAMQKLKEIRLAAPTQQKER